MSDAPQAVDLDSKPFPEPWSTHDPSMRVPRKTVDESTNHFEIISSNQTDNAPNDSVPPHTVSNASMLSSIPILSGISFPPNMDPNIILSSDRALSLLEQLDSKQIQAAVDEFADAMSNKGERVRSVQAYFIGVVKRYVSASHKDTPSHPDNNSKGAIMGMDLSPAVKVCPKIHIILFVVVVIFSHFFLLIHRCLLIFRIVLINSFLLDIVRETNLKRL